MKDKNMEVSPFTDKVLYRKYSLILIFVMVITLIPHYGKIFSPEIEVSWAMILHGFLYLTWYFLFSAQSHLVSNKNITLHKKMGVLSVILVVLLFSSGLYLLLGVMHGYDSNWSSEYLLSRTSFVWAIIHTLTSFTGFYVLGIITRKQLYLHKRFMLLASLSMVSASVTRVAFLPFVPIDGMLLTLLTTYILFICPVIFDRVAFGKVHAVYKWAVPGYIISQIFFIGIIPVSGFGQALAFPFGH